MPRRVSTLLVAALLIGAPAAVLRALCVGRACETTEETSAVVPFCSLPEAVRAPLASGFREGRSPEVLAVAGDRPVVGPRGVTWPSLSSRGGRGPGEVPVVFAGTGVRRGATVPPGTGLDDVAPTIAETIGLRRPHPEVRSGEAVEGIATGRAPRLVLEVILEGTGSERLETSKGAWPYLRSLMSAGASTLDGDAGSLPLDPVATLTTIGTGGLPSQHGITGRLVRNDSGRLVPAWGKGAPLSVIATLGDDLDERFHQRPAIGLVATAASDRGVIGGNWYVDVDRDLVVVAPKDQVDAARTLLLSRAGFGRDRVPDLLAVVLQGDIAGMDRDLRALVGLARRASSGSVSVIVTATGDSGAGPREAVSSSRVAKVVERRLDVSRRVIEGVAPGGLFLDQETLAAESISADEVTSALRAMGSSKDEPLFADAFPSLAVSFARYC